ncbi:Avirulence protein [Phytophthora megakarya]|uniref:RxLR effector protein n=1 Tax=Phytophthora megakarya TaxID=4795 RepID=A0A225V5G3_9STRA|nr:Avirulence protein [Phytophthora megakarya]
MRICYFLFASVVIVGECFNTVSAINGADKDKLVSTESVEPSNGHAQRLLRTDKTEKKEAEDHDEERGIFDFVKTASLPYLDDLAEYLHNVPGAGETLQREVDKLFKLIVAKGWTPDSMAENIKIASKTNTMTEDALKVDPDYQLWVHFSKFWDEHKA